MYVIFFSEIEKIRQISEYLFNNKTYVVGYVSVRLRL